MKRLIIYTIISLGLLYSCAQDKDLNMDAVATASFHEWLAKNDPQAKPFVDKNGVKYQDIYIRYIVRGPVLSDLQKLKDYGWCYLSYVGYTLSGEIFVSRESLQAHIAGAWANTTHWTDDFVHYYNQNTFLSKGLMNLLPSLNTDDSVRVYFNGSQTFTTTLAVNEGYAGQTDKYVNFPCYMDLKMGQIVSDAYQAEIDSVNYFARTKWQMATKDTLRKGVYVKTVTPNPAGAPIGDDTVVLYYATERFLDGFLIQTNDREIAKKANRYDKEADTGLNGDSPYEPLRKQVNEGGGMSETLVKVIQGMKKGEKVDMLTTSTYSPYGNEGSFSNLPQILPFQPVIITIQVLDTVVKGV